MVKGMLPMQMRNYILNLIYKKEEVITHFLFFRQFITHIHQKLDLVILRSTIQRYAQPMSLIHMPSGDDTWFLTE